MEKVVNPRYFYRCYLRAPISGEKCRFEHAITMRAAVYYWTEMHSTECFDPSDIVIEQRRGDKWVVISGWWKTEDDARFALFQHEVDLELMNYHERFCKKGDAK